ncbi:MAG: hypothetical protein AB1779_03505 [Candidatus Thermoplasmatota archaeon]
MISMKSKIIVFVLVGMFFLIPFVVADNDSMYITITFDKKEYKAGDGGKATVHVFDKGEYAEPDKQPELTTFYPNDLTLKPLTKISKGVYSADFEISTKPSTDYISLDTYASIGKESEVDETYNEERGYSSISIKGMERKGIDVSIITDPYINPKSGDSIGINVEVKSDGKLSKPDKFSLNVYEVPGEEMYFIDNGYKERKGRDLTYQEVGTGLYKATYIVGKIQKGGIDASFVAEIEARAEFGDEISSTSTSIPIDYYNIWYHNTSITDAKHDFEIYVREKDGKKVEIMNLTMKYSGDLKDAPDIEGLLEYRSTTPGGIPKFSITYTPDKTNFYIELKGFVNTSKASQYFASRIYINRGETAPPYQPGEGFDVYSPSTIFIYPVGKAIIREYIAYYEKKPLASKEIYWYASACIGGRIQTGIHKYGKITTDSNGKFSLNLPGLSESGSINLVFECGVKMHNFSGYPPHNSNDGLYYEPDWDYISVGEPQTPGMPKKDENIKISLPSLIIGKTSKIEVKIKGYIPKNVMAGWFIGSVEIEKLFYLEFESYQQQNWCKLGHYSYSTMCMGGDFLLLSKKGEKYEGNVIIPDFLPKGKYTIFVIVMKEDGTTVYNYAIVESKTAVEVKQDIFTKKIIGPITIPILIIIIVVVFAVFGLMFFFVRKRKMEQIQPPYQPPIQQPYQPPKPNVYNCPYCNSIFQIGVQTRPITVACPNCNKPVTIK